MSKRPRPTDDGSKNSGIPVISERQKNRLKPQQATILRPMLVDLKRPPRLSTLSQPPSLPSLPEQLPRRTRADRDRDEQMHQQRDLDERRAVRDSLEQQGLIQRASIGQRNTFTEALWNDPLFCGELPSRRVQVAKKEGTRRVLRRRRRKPRTESSSDVLGRSKNPSQPSPGFPYVADARAQYMQRERSLSTGDLPDPPSANVMSGAHSDMEGTEADKAIVRVLVERKRRMAGKFKK